MPKKVQKPMLIFSKEPNHDFVLCLTHSELDVESVAAIEPHKEGLESLLGKPPKKGSKIDTEGALVDSSLMARVYWIEDRGWLRWAEGQEAGKIEVLFKIGDDWLSHQPVKVCNSCRQLKDYCEFHGKKRKDSYCAECRNAKKKSERVTSKKDSRVKFAEKFVVDASPMEAPKDKEKFAEELLRILGEK